MSRPTKDQLDGAFWIVGVIAAITIFVGAARATAAGVAVKERAATQARVELLQDLNRAELVSLTVTPQTLMTPTGTIARESARVCTALPITTAFRKCAQTYWISYQSDPAPTYAKYPEALDAFPNFDAPNAWYLMPPLSDGQEFGIQLTLRRDYGAYAEDRYTSRVLRFKAREVAGFGQPRFRLEPINEVTLDRISAGGHP